jgi:hypothetical protein
MSLTQSNNENKENHYHHLVQVSPEKQRKSHRNGNILGDVSANSLQLNEIQFGMKKKKQLEELWLQPVARLDTSLEEIVD